MKVASKVRKTPKKTGGFVSEKVTTVPPTREDPSRVVTDYFPAKYSMFWHDKKGRVYHELHATLRGSKVTTIEGICGEPLTQTVRDYGSAGAAKDAFGAIRLEKYAANWLGAGSGARTDFFFVGPPKERAAAKTDTTPVPAKIEGYASDGRLVDDVARLLPGAKKLGKKLPVGTRAELAKHARALPKETQKALLGLADACASGKLRQLGWTFTLGARLADNHGPALADLLGGNKKWLDLASKAIEIAHDGGLAHYVACPDGVRVYNNEGSFEAVVTPSVDAFMWGLVHRTAVEHGSYDPKAFKAGLKKLGIKRELALKE